MADGPQDVGGGRGDVGEDRARSPGTPRWVVRFWLVALVLALLLVLHIAVGGFRGHGGP